MNGPVDGTSLTHLKVVPLSVGWGTLRVACIASLLHGAAEDFILQGMPMWHLLYTKSLFKGTEMNEQDSINVHELKLQFNLWILGRSTRHCSLALTVSDVTTSMP